jgi:hypothetical protein
MTSEYSPKYFQNLTNQIYRKLILINSIFFMNHDCFPLSILCCLFFSLKTIQMNENLPFRSITLITSSSVHLQNWLRKTFDFV